MTPQVLFQLSKLKRLIILIKNQSNN